jgi:lysyl-tRNA synthetase class II
VPEAGSNVPCRTPGFAAILAVHSSERVFRLQFEPRDQFEQRQKKLEQIQQLGLDPFPREFRWTHTPAQLLEAYGQAQAQELEAAGLQVRVAGRIVSLRHLRTFWAMAHVCRFM